MNTDDSINLIRRQAGRRVSRRKVVRYGGVGLAASALATTGLGQRTSAADTATPVAMTGPSGTTLERVTAASSLLDARIDEWLGQTGVPGLAVAAVFQDQIVHLAGYGLRDRATFEPVDADTVFQIASVSKCLAATTVAAVVGDEAVTWNARISDLDPTFQMYDPYVTHEVTVADLFSHRSGLPDHAGDDLEDLGYDREEVLHRLRYVRPGGPFRAHYDYTNFGVTAAAVSVAKAVGATWEQLTESRLYQPLGMASTSSRYDDFMSISNRARGHVFLDGIWQAKYQRQPDAQSPAGGVSSSVRDLTQWIRLLLGNGTIDGQEIVAAEALGEMFRPYFTSNQAADPTIDRTGFYGLGWNVGYDELGRVRFNHSGAFALGAATHVSIIPSEQIGVVVLTNAAPIGLAETVALSYLDLALTGTVAQDYLQFIGPIFEAMATPKYGQDVDYSVPPADPGESLAPDNYVGEFDNDYYGKISVTVDGDALVLHLGPDQTAFPLRHYNNDIFLYQPVGENAGGESAVTFSVGTDGLASTVTIEILNLNKQGTFIRGKSLG
jgi:CubicO group peptidase (beta-lactamase class C family)